MTDNHGLNKNAFQLNTNMSHHRGGGLGPVH